MPVSEPKRPRFLVHGALALVGVLFGANYVIAKIALREVSPIDIVVIRTWGTAALLFGVTWLRTGRRPDLQVRQDHRRALTASDLAQLFLYSLLGVSINQVCFLEGLSRSTATNAALVLVLIPVLTLAIAVLLRRERATLTGVLGIGVGLTGALLLILPRGGVDMSSASAIGNLFLLGSGCAYALYLVLTRPILARHEPLRVVSWIFLLAAVTVTPIDIGGMRAVFAHGLSPAGWASMAYVIVGATAVPYLLNNWALVRVKSSVVAVYILLQPIIAGVLGRVVLDERLGPHAAVAGILIVAGVVLSAWKRA
jgi:drug/metabolite transporter (DMT)-like permease